MARGVNKVIIIGNLGQDPETKYLPSGASVTKFSVAVSERWKDKQTGEIKERTEWVNVEVWGNAAEACQKYINKGSKVYVEGKLQTDSWDDKDTGAKRYRTKVRADNVQFLDSKDSGNRPPETPAPGQAGGKPNAAEYDDDIPF